MLLSWVFLEKLELRICQCISYLADQMWHLLYNPISLRVSDLLPAEHQAGKTTGSNKRRAGHRQGEINAQPLQKLADAS